MALLLVLGLFVAHDVEAVCYTCEQDPNSTYGTYVRCVAAANGTSGMTDCWTNHYTDMRCNFAGSSCTGTCPDQDNDGECDDMEENGCPPSVCGSPVVIGRNGNYQFTSPGNGVRFDVNADGVAEQTAWTVPGSNVAFLAIDRNSDGQITTGKELFGNKTAPRITDGFAVLATYDVDRNGVLDRDDGAWWQALLLWVDADHDGASDPDELTRVADSDIEWISVASFRTDRKDGDGNHYRYRSVARRGGKTVPIWDVFLRSMP